MANVLAPFGFRHVGYLNGSMPNFAPGFPRKISKSNATAIFQGDPVTSQSTGYVAQSSPGTTQIAGIFQSVSFQSTSLNGQTRRALYWPGSDAQSDPVAQVLCDPMAVFMAQANAQALPSHVGQNANFAIGTGTTGNGQSGATLDISTVATTSTLPFRIIGLATFDTTAPWMPSLAYGANGADQTTPFNYVYVAFNNQDFKSLTGI